MHCYLDNPDIRQENIGGAGEDRTPDPLRARQVLSQLSYNPIFCKNFFLNRICFINFSDQDLLFLVYLKTNCVGALNHSRAFLSY